MNQIIKRRSTPETRAGQYMCPDCGKIFDTKKEVDTHKHTMHDPDVTIAKKGLSANFITNFSV